MKMEAIPLSIYLQLLEITEDRYKLEAMKRQPQYK